MTSLPIFVENSEWMQALATTKSFFISDLHLRPDSKRNREILLRFFHSLTSEPNPITLFLLGDIFDVWVADHSVFIKQFEPEVNAIADLVQRGHNIVYVEGNHDLHLDHFWAKKIGCHVYTKPQYFKQGETVIRAEHGDLINLEDESYLKWHAQMRSPWLRFLGRWLPGSFWVWVGERYNAKSRPRNDLRMQQDDIVGMIRNHAPRSFEEQPFDYVVTGHMHVRDEFEFQEGKWSINTGSWINMEPKALVIDSEGHHFQDLQ